MNNQQAFPGMDLPAVPGAAPAAAERLMDGARDRLATLSAHEPLVGLALISAVLAAPCIEAWWSGRAGDASARGAATFKRLAQGFRAEAVGLAVLGMLAATLLAWGAGSPPTTMSHADEEIWQATTSEWPLLGTADTLLALQAMLRLLLMASTALRTGRGAPLLPGNTAAFFCLAALVRTAMRALSPADVYRLDGPLGGACNFVLEVSVLPFLAHLSRQAVCAGPRNVLTIAACALIAAGTAWCNRLALAEDKAHLDMLFTLEHILELFAATAFLARTLAAPGCKPQCQSAAFVYAALPVQQLLSAYFMLTAFGGEPLEPMPEIVSVGHPLEVLQIAGVVQVGMYSVAGALHLAFHDEPDCESPAPQLS